MATVTSSPFNLNPVKVNIRLCGSLPRHEMDSTSDKRCSNHFTDSRSMSFDDYLTEKFNSLSNETRHTIEDERVSCIAESVTSNQEQLQVPPSRQVSPEFEAPSWAVPAHGEARLEPICDSLHMQEPVDLTERPVFRVGRSPLSDVQLLHATSSRRHAMIFHHANGSCYLVDCGSAHGTFVNGVRVTSPPNGGVVVPHRVRQGSIIRFGGPGAPQYMLKSFTFDLDEMRFEASLSDSMTPSSAMHAVVQRNTRLNSLGKTAKESLFTALSSKRSFESMDTADLEEDPKRMRCSSPPLSPEIHHIRLVSPEVGQPSKRRRVSFSSEPPQAFYPNLISPDLSSDENDDM